MSDENIQEPTAVDPSELDALKRSIEGLEKKNFELIGKLKKKETPEQPSDYEELVEFKRQAEQKELEAKGEYSKALQSREDQFRNAVKEKDDKIKKLEAKIHDLQLISPALSALSNAVHDTDYALEKLGKDKFEIADDGSVVYVDEFSRMTIEEAVQKKLAANDRTKWVVKKPVARGGGASQSGSSTGSGVDQGDLKYFLKGTENLDEQTRIYKQQGPEVWRKLRELAESR
jgi:predicted RNase H-like nuclease (RuvC/YqgF family)